MPDLTFITATPPTPNGELHIGHLAGPYVAADVYRRYVAATGGRAVMTTGQDDHQSYVQVRGLRDGRAAEDVADGYAERIEAAWRDVGAIFDVSLRPRRDDEYAAFVQHFFLTLHRRGALVERSRPLPYCVPCDRWLYEAYVTGGCPHCKASSGGNACEVCGRPNSCGDLIDPACVVCGEPAELREQRRLFFPLARYEQQLAAYWERVTMPPHLRVLCEQMRRDGLPEIAVSHPADWGVPVPAEVGDFADQRIYVWFEMAPGYLLQARQAAQRNELGDESALMAAAGSFVQFFGFDNGYFHAVLFPAMFMAYDATVRLPDHFVVNEFYRLEGKKFSTSRRHAIWASELLATTDPDVLRFHLLADRPDGRQTSFSLPALEATREHLRTHWDGWIDRLTTAIVRDADGVVPAYELSGPSWEALAGTLRRTLADLRAAYELPRFDTRRITALLDELVQLGADHGHLHGHYAALSPRDPRHLAGLVAQLVVAQALAAWAAPVLPGAAARLAGLIGHSHPLAVDETALQPPRPGRRIRRPDGPVFGA
ncbi:MAG TPA: class I tRNA ligase family protein [Pseudonocardiaceae bacterium]